MRIRYLAIFTLGAAIGGAFCHFPEREIHYSGIGNPEQESAGQILLWNYESKVWETPDCATDMECETKYSYGEEIRELEIESNYQEQEHGNLFKF